MGQFIDLIGEKVILENGEITEILAHDDNIIRICVNGVTKTYNFKISFIEKTPYYFMEFFSNYSVYFFLLLICQITIPAIIMINGKTNIMVMIIIFCCSVTVYLTFS